MCQIIPFWDDVFERCGFSEKEIYHVYIARHPVEVAKSQCKRRAVDPEFYVIGENLIETISLWFSLTYQALRSIRADHNIFLLFSDLVSDPKSQVVRLAKFLDIECSTQAVDEYCNNFVDKNLRRNVTDIKEM